MKVSVANFRIANISLVLMVEADQYEEGTFDVAQPRPGSSQATITLNNFTGVLNFHWQIKMHGGDPSKLIQPTPSSAVDNTNKGTTNENKSCKDRCGKNPSQSLAQGAIQKILREDDDKKKAGASAPTPTITTEKNDRNGGGGNKPTAGGTKNAKPSPTFDCSDEMSDDMSYDFSDESDDIDDYDLLEILESHGHQEGWWYN